MRQWDLGCIYMCAYGASVSGERLSFHECFMNINMIVRYVISDNNISIEMHICTSHHTCSCSYLYYVYTCASFA